MTTVTVHCVEEAPWERIVLEYTKGELRSLGKFLKEKIALGMDSVTLGSEAAAPGSEAAHTLARPSSPGLCVDTLYICYR